MDGVVRCSRQQAPIVSRIDKVIDRRLGRENVPRRDRRERFAASGDRSVLLRADRRQSFRYDVPNRIDSLEQTQAVGPIPINNVTTMHDPMPV